MKRQKELSLSPDDNAIEAELYHHDESIKLVLNGGEDTIFLSTSQAVHLHKTLKACLACLSLEAGVEYRAEFMPAFTEIQRIQRAASGPDLSDVDSFMDMLSIKPPRILSGA